MSVLAHPAFHFYVRHRGEATDHPVSLLGSRWWMFPGVSHAEPEQVVGLLPRLNIPARQASSCALHHDSPFQLLVATILSAQCTDERVGT